jgi:hypothetical protein
MSDLCPVYAPFFGAMVRSHGRSDSFVRETLIRPFYPHLFDCRVVPVPSCLHVRLLRCVYLLTPLLTHVPGIGARQVSSLRIACLPLHFTLQLTTLLRSYGTAKAGVGISATSVLRPDLMMKNSVPVVMAGIIAVSAHTLVELKK